MARLGRARPQRQILTEKSVAAAVACDQLLPPDAILVQTALSGAVTDIDEPVASPDGNWLLLSP